ncbi:hypothetical protein BKA58DRAFT_125496 [Alternaria rosae]|uniref:uncharacterized protein n=1 Tax=Alternaria rosae TaxID=1187941 RepID=UPI001E8CFE95|nr:uncharacterized protein BKA58DRAFT_125496 [Alternaria rosae]KAH6875644.1 hypothetical protein BKA58DRAFT_125496 [Alternaria rosae]
MFQTQRQYMLVCIAELFEESNFANARARFPAIEDSFGRPLQEAVAQNLEKLSGNMDISPDDHTSQDFIDALVFILDIAKNRNPTKLVQLTQPLFGNNTCYIENLHGSHGSVQNNIFVEGSLHDISSWRPDAWLIPTDDDLSRMEKLVCEPKEHGTLLYEWCHVTNPIRLSNNKYNFSAVAVAIDFRNHIPQKRLYNLRKLILYEDFKSGPRSV